MQTIIKSTIGSNVVAGRVGDWHAEFEKELNEKADKWIVENLKRIDIQFPISMKKE